MPVEQLRNMLFIALCFTGFLIWQAWQQDYAPRPPSRPETPSQAAPDGQAPEVPSIPAAAGTADPGETAPADATGQPAIPGPAGSAAPLAPAPVAGEAVAATNLVEVKTDRMRVRIDPTGGNIISIDLLDYALTTEDPTPFPLLEPNYPDRFIALFGLRTASGASAPDHTTALSVDADTRFEMTDGSDALEVPLEFAGADGLRVRKVFSFSRDRYVINVRYEVSNDSAETWSGSIYGHFERPNVEQSVGLGQTYTYTGGVVSTEEKPYEKISFGDMEEDNLVVDTPGGWIAMIEHYFTAAIVPAQEQNNRFYTLMRPGVAPLFNIGVIAPTVSVAPGETANIALDLYAGPKIAERLEALVPGLERTVDYGWLWIIAQPLFWLLDHIHDLVGNWGWSVILLTLCIKLAFFHLSATSYKSMARMRKLQPRMTQLRERYGDDKQKLNQSMMELYKTEKVNPLGGCLPIVVQIPVFISLYWVLLESVELRQAPFMLWIKDMSEHDPYFVLPLAMGVTMYAQQKLNPTPPDPMQARIMQFLPIVFTALFLFFPAGLVLYWFVNNLLSIAQQWVITRKIVGTEPDKPASA